MLPDIKKVMDGLYNEMALINMDQKDYQMDHTINKYLKLFYPQERIFNYGINRTKFPDIFLLDYFLYKNPSYIDLRIGDIKAITREYQYENNMTSARIQLYFDIDREKMPFGENGRMNFAKIKDLLDGRREG